MATPTVWDEVNGGATGGTTVALLVAELVGENATVTVIVTHFRSDDVEYSAIET
jgi:hypothetical protein